MNNGSNLCQKLTILVPTLDRPDFIVRLLNYYALIRFNGKIIIGDSSHDQNAELNRQTVDHFQGRLDLTYQYYPVTSFLHDGMCQKAMIDLVSTPYVVYCGDDDFLIPGGLSQCIAFLDQNREFIAAFGLRVNLQLDQIGPFGQPIGASALWHTEFLDSSPAARWAQYTDTCFSTQYSVHRRETWQRMYRDVDSTPSRYLGTEFLPCSLTVIQGKMKKLDCFTLVFQRNPNQVFSFDQHSLFSLIHQPEWLPSCHTMKRSITEELVAKAALSTHDAEQLFEKQFWAHLYTVLAIQYQKKYQLGKIQDNLENPETLQKIMAIAQVNRDMQPVLKALAKASA